MKTEDYTELKNAKYGKTKGETMSKPTTITIDEIEYVRKDSISEPASNKDGLPYVVIRSRDSGVHAGYLQERRGDEVDLIDSRRLWYWDGAATLSQVAMEGVKKPSNCKFAVTLPKITVLGICEVINATEAARSNIESVEAWKE